VFPWKPNGVSRGTGVVHRVARLAFSREHTSPRPRVRRPHRM